MKKIFLFSLLTMISFNAVANIYNIKVAPDNELSAQLTPSHWKFRSRNDHIVIENATSRTIEVMFHLNGKVIDDSGVLHPSDLVSVQCNNSWHYFRYDTTMFCEIKAGLSFSAEIQGSGYVNGAEGTFEIL